MSGPTIVWFRDDLRLADNPALEAAIAQGGPILPLFVRDDAAAGAWPIGAAAGWWLGRSLDRLDESLGVRGARLVRRRGASTAILEELVAETGARAIVWNRRYTPSGMAQDRAIKAAFKARGLEVRSFKAALLVEPMAIAGPAGSFSAFFDRWRRQLRPEPQRPAPGRIEALQLQSDHLGLPDQGSDPWSAKLARLWTVGESAAHTRLAAFVERGLAGYAKCRHRLDRDGVSGLSPHLRTGEIAPAALFRTLAGRPASAYLRQLAWREYAAWLLFHRPDLPDIELMAERRAIAWRDDRDGLRSWQRGETGYDLVDAGMRQLWASGWMHNRARMVTASFLVKHLLIDWRLGQRWFWDTLVDADLANNAMGWQWSASVGADARSFVRVFDPTAQAERFDPDGLYRARWLGSDRRPAAVVEHRSARLRALDAYGVGTVDRRKS